MRPQGDRVAVTPLFAVVCGCVLGLVVFAASAALYRAGMHAVAGIAAESILLLALACVAAITVLAQPTRMRRARVKTAANIARESFPVCVFCRLG